MFKSIFITVRLYLQLISGVYSILMDELLIMIAMLVIAAVLIRYCTSYKKDMNERMIKGSDKKFYRVDEVCPQLNGIYDDLEEIKREVNSVIDERWMSWPEKYLYKDGGDWNIFPFYAFNTVAVDNCKRCPRLYSFLQKIPGLRLATLSRMTSGVKLSPHEGWASHSNNVLRCHFGFVVPDGCYISVREISSHAPDDEEEVRFHEEDRWLILDDAKTHYAHNSSDRDRIILIIDVDRPKHIKRGRSTVKDSHELINVIEYFKRNNNVIKDTIRLPNLD